MREIKILKKIQVLFYCLLSSACLADVDLVSKNGSKMFFADINSDTALGFRYYVNNSVSVVTGVEIRKYNNEVVGSNVKAETNSNTYSGIAGIRRDLLISEFYSLFSEVVTKISYKKDKFETDGNKQSQSFRYADFYINFGGEYFLHNRVSLEAKMGFEYNYGRHNTSGAKNTYKDYGTYRSGMSINYYF